MKCNMNAKTLLLFAGCLAAGAGRVAPLNVAHCLAAAEPAQAAAPSSEGGGFRIFDGFEGELELKWKPIRPDPTHFSLTKHPGKLAITTQYGSIRLAADARPVPLAKNIFLIDSPPPEDPGFVVTACLDSFQPTTPYQQAGVILLDDEDNYLKFVCEFNRWNGVIWNLLREVDAQSSAMATPLEAGLKTPVWLRLTARGACYEYATSTDGETFTAHGELPWGDGHPKQVGLLAKNGGTEAPSDIDACFDSFEVRSLTEAERNEPRFLQRRKLAGAWEVVSCEVGGERLKDAPLSQFVFSDTKVAVKEKTETLEIEYRLDVSKAPKQLTLLPFVAPRTRELKGIYSLEGAALVICYNLGSDAEAPSEFKTNEGDGRMLVTMKRIESKD